MERLVLTARPLSVWDALFCWRLANEPSIRSASWDTTGPTWWGHVRWMLAWLFKRDRQAWVIRAATWFDGSMASTDWVLLDPRCGFVPVGLARVQQDGPVAVVSIATHPDQRGRGIGLFGVEIATMRAEQSGWPTPVAYIKADNHPSIGLFAKAGYQMVGARDGLVTMRRRAV